MENLRKYIAEFLGIAVIVFIGTGTIVFTSFERNISLLAVAMAFAFSVVIAVYAFGSVSGGHFNPAVSLGMAINKRISWKTFFTYTISQVLGGIFGSALVYVLTFSYVRTGNLVSAVTATGGTEISAKDFIEAAGIGQTDFAPGNAMGAFIAEVIITFLLVTLIMVATSQQNAALAPLVGIIAGFTIGGLALVAAPISGAAMNPARALAPALFAKGEALNHVWIYIIADMVGAALAAYTARYVLRSENNDVIEIGEEITVENNVKENNKK